MKLIIYVTESATDGIQVRFRASDSAAFHILEAGYFGTIEDALEYAEVFARGARIANAVTQMAFHSIDPEGTDLEDFPEYTSEMMIQDFNHAWTALGGL